MKNTSLPENAYRELREGEEYKPIMSAETTPAEATPYSVTMGIIISKLLWQLTTSKPKTSKHLKNGAKTLLIGFLLILTLNNFTSIYGKIRK